MQIVVVNHSVKAAHCNDSSDEAKMSQWQKSQFPFTVSI